jgi:site-specific recombinase XerC
MLAHMIGRLRRRQPAVWPLDEYRTHLQLVMAKRSVGTKWHAVHYFSRSHPDPWAVSRGDVEAYLVALTGRSGEATYGYRRSVLASLRTFYRWAVETGRTRVDPTEGIVLKSGRDGKGRPCDELAYRRALKNAPDDDQRLMVELVCRAGLRVSEVAAVRGADVTPDGRWLDVVGKGSKPRRVPITADVAEMILAGGPGFRFPGGRGRERTHLTPGNVGVKVGRLLPNGYSAHSGRHHAATMVYGRTHNLEAVRQVLGHNSIATTQTYLGVSGDDVWAAWTGA